MTEQYSILRLIAIVIYSFIHSYRKQLPIPISTLHRHRAADQKQGDKSGFAPALKGLVVLFYSLS